MHSFTHDDFNIRRHYYIRPRSELYHAKLFPAFYSLAPPLPTDNPAGEHPGNLHALYGELGALDVRLFCSLSKRDSFFVAIMN